MKESNQVANPVGTQSLPQPSAGVYRRFLMSRERKAALRTLNVMGRLNRVLNLSHGFSGSLNLLLYAKGIDVIDSTFNSLDGDRTLCLTGFKEGVERPKATSNGIDLVTDAVDCVFCQGLLPELSNTEERESLIGEFSRITSQWLVVSHAVSSRRRSSNAIGSFASGKAVRASIPDDLMSFELAKGGFDVVAKIRVGPFISDHCFYVSRLRQSL